jgi:hypothetical protein
MKPVDTSTPPEPLDAKPDDAREPDADAKPKRKKLPKQRAYEKRQRRGGAVFPVERHYDRTRNLLKDVGLLCEADMENREKVELAFAQYVGELLEHTPPSTVRSWLEK